MEIKYVVTCKVEGCEECGDSYSIIGIFSSEQQAKDVAEVHSKLDHIHYADVNVEKIEVDKAIHDRDQHIILKKVC